MTTLQAIFIGALISVEGLVAFQFQPKPQAKRMPDAPDDYMQEMSGEMALLDTNYDLTFNISPTSRIHRRMPPELVQSNEQAKLQKQSDNEAKNIQVLVTPWPKDDGMRDSAVEWDSLGTNYDYSFNNSPTGNRCKETEKRQAQLKAKLHAAQAAAALEAEPLVSPLARNHWEQWMSLSVTPGRDVTSLAWPRVQREIEQKKEVCIGRPFQSYLDSL
ncbi:expressed unknown protein [Seminavis robusta]|uniref:Uncharacterized protein n=1 Tax=Seminavis robusta TaxID=568900 RepID=A0A9N8HFE3_9STRA|nr:expressed unknown protein [Seminavis robusta]|eukprot:Sro346_g122650.1 n/a (217) ;mRNA; r:23276-24016